MKMTLLDRSECFRAFLLLIGQDLKITREERGLLLKIGSILGFEASFCKTSIDDLLENKYINSGPPKFSSPEIAKAFLKDAIRVAFVDAGFPSEEIRWLQSIAEANGLNDAWLECEMVAFQGQSDQEAASLQIERCV